MNPVLLGAIVGVSVMVVVLTVTALGLWFERKWAARMQTRIGPNMLGPWGLLQVVADVVKLFQKEDIRPENSDAVIFEIAPPLALFCALGSLAVLPVTPEWMGANLDVGVLYILAIGAITVLAVFAGGWATNNKFALLGGMRAVAQSVSYEVPLVLTAMVPVILAGSMNVNEIVKWQQAHHWLVGLSPVTLLGLPAFVLFLLAMLAESNRIPFDIPEAESELVGGITTEYTGMKFATFYVAEYVHTMAASMVAATLFLGGWDGPFAPGIHWIALKTLLLFGFVYWTRWTLLRFRSDQLMRLCWTWLVPFSLVLVACTAVYVVMVP